MDCRSVRVRESRDKDGRPCVLIVLGNMRAVGCHDEVAWSDMPIGMARQIAADILEAAAEAERK